jgi:hypothetical protein
MLQFNFDPFPEIESERVMLRKIGKADIDDLFKFRSESNVNPENQASIKFPERNGFVREAYFRENYFYDEKLPDSGIYSLLTPLKKNHRS